MFKKLHFIVLIACFQCLYSCAIAQVTAPAETDTPSIHPAVDRDSLGYFVQIRDRKLYEYVSQPRYSLEQLQGDPKGNDQGLNFDFGNINGTLYYGFIPYGDSKHPMPVYFRKSVAIDSGKSHIEIRHELSGRYDMVDWEKSGRGTLGYRVVDYDGQFLYDGKVSFYKEPDEVVDSVLSLKPFMVDLTLIEGPFVNRVTENSVTLSFSLNQSTVASVVVDGRSVTSPSSDHHEIKIDGLKANTAYDYEIKLGSQSYKYQLKTSPQPGGRQPFVFSYASDSRSGNGGGERDMWGANFYIMKRIMALNKFKEVAFMQFSGDLVNGYSTHPEEMHVQYANWKRSIEPFANSFPVYVSMGNHEALTRNFVGNSGDFISLDRFPYATESAEALFAQNFVNPTNGPESEDGAVYDTTPAQDFPSYEENVFYYTYDNVAVIVMNSDYWYSPSTRAIRMVGGGLHGYIMDNQLEWLRTTVATLESDENIDHIFVTQHTPFFPNGGHVQDDMWYNGNNQYRPYVGGKPLAKGIIERRDQLLDILVNQSQKTIAIFTGDEHNYARTEIGPDTKIYPEPYFTEKIELSRTIYQINNGAAGAPYYAQENTPWTPFVSGFTTQNALVFFKVNGKSVEMEVINPDTLEKFDQLKLR